MDFSLIFDNIEIIVTSLGGWVIITYIGSKYLAERLADKMKIKWTSEENQKLEQLRAEIKEENAIFSSFIDSFSFVQQNNYPERVLAIKNIWENVLSVRKMASKSQFFYDVFAEEEYNKIIKEPKISDFIKNELDINIFSPKIDTIKSETEINRPFLGEGLWVSFELYLTFVGRSSFLLWDGYRKNDVVCWHKDDSVKSLLKQVFNDEEMKNISSEKFGSFSKGMQIFENRILLEISKMTSGESEAIKRFEELESTRELTQKMYVDRELQEKSDL
ncbi:hypothetical protein HWN40_05555 [Methanolobus zinderi]|uniref:Uncharacterized protein n=1 Tax=Methanolobus zinderi TaxID=536044 RepID=A0A7D5J8J0_9EURY|nr:hypothetical protein [Methanolobus zinderi]QLC49750.1 hypothetical protein HWN40_05555 [Methanolobus zinderi]